ELVGVQETIVEGDEEIIVTSSCLEGYEETMIDERLNRHDCILLPPLKYAAGTKTCRVIAIDPSKLTNFYRDLSKHTKVTVEGKREVSDFLYGSVPFTTDESLPSLSKRQREVLTTAYHMGYYQIPRETTTEEIAAEIGIARRTAEQHLRRAENKVINTLMNVSTPFKIESKPDAYS
ncbi:MAG: helix-turn-helix domain-containing protein, partial [Halobacteriaceae archaeon]